MKLVSCDTTTCGLCNDNSTDTEQVIRKYLPNDQFIVNQTCVSCPSDWSPLKGRCFKGFSSSFNYNNSLADCKSKNASLAILNTDDKFNLVKSLLPAINSGYYVNNFFFGKIFLYFNIFFFKIGASSYASMKFSYNDGSLNLFKYLIILN